MSAISGTMECSVDVPSQGMQKSAEISRALSHAVRGAAVTQCDEPTQAQIDETHARFVEAVQVTFEQHKHILGPAWAAKKLLVV